MQENKIKDTYLKDIRFLSSVSVKPTFLGLHRSLSAELMFPWGMQGFPEGVHPSFLPRR